MEDRGLRDIERWRDKIEVRLDNRQVFFLFFGSALVACMLFVLGVIVGKRLESRGRAVSPEIEDPLALLDKVATSSRPAQAAVTFPQALFGAANKASAGDKHAKKAMLPAANTPEDELVARKPLAAATHEAKVEEGNALLAPAAPVTETKPAPTKPAAKPESKPIVAAIAEKSSVPAPSKAKPAVVQETKPAVIPPVAKPAVIPTVAASSESKSKGRFALQLSSFQDKSEAEAFAQKFDSERPYMVVSEIEGKGTWYRVRVGDYASAKDATAAKQSFEKKHNVIAYVAQK
jgi:septal ring-binding cell division protein DamX